MAGNHPISYLEALRLNFKTDSSFTTEAYSKLQALYSIMGDSELYDGIMSSAEDEEIDEWHVSTLQLMEDRAWGC